MQNITVNQQSTLEFNKLDPKNIFYNKNGDYISPKINIIAKSGCGKSWLVRDLLDYVGDIPVCMIICPYDGMTKFYEKNFPNCASCIYHQYEEGLIGKVLARQKMILRENEKRIKEGKKPIDPRCVFIMDDCMSSKHLWLKDPSFLELMTCGRFYQITFILTMQYSLGIQPELRCNFDHVFLLGEYFINNKKKLYKHYAGMFPSKDTFFQVFDQITDDYGCMVINNRLRSSDICQKVFWYKAENRGVNQRLGRNILTFKNEETRCIEEDYVVLENSEEVSLHTISVSDSSEESDKEIEPTCCSYFNPFNYLF